MEDQGAKTTSENPANKAIPAQKVKQSLICLQSFQACSSLLLLRDPEMAKLSELHSK